VRRDPDGAGSTLVTEPAHETDHPNLHPGQYDEGGEGGMATRELAAHHADEREQTAEDED
jgi:hypothetical protein